MVSDKIYISTITIRHVAGSPKDALKQAQAVCNHINKDDETPEAAVEKLHVKPHGCVVATELNIENLKKQTIGEDPIPFPFAPVHDDLPF